MKLHSPLPYAFVLPALLTAACGASEAQPSPPVSEDPSLPETIDGGAPQPDAAWPPTPDGDAGTDADAAAATYAINHVLVTGQSNAVGNSATPVVSKTQPFTNLMFDTGVMPMTACDGDGCTQYQTPASLVPLVEGDAYFAYQVEKPASGLANEISHLSIAERGTAHDVLVSVHARSGNTYACIRKGGCAKTNASHLVAFDQGLMEVASARSLAASLGKTYGVRAVVAIHGESDHYAYVGGWSDFPLSGTDGTPAKLKDYADALLEWQADYEAGVRAITGQPTAIPLLYTQISGWTGAAYSKVAQMQLDAHVRSNGKVVLVGPAYALSFSSDCLHFDEHGERRLGEYIGKVYAKVVLGGEAWDPLRPQKVTRAANVITVKFHVPSPPLVLDTTRVTDPGQYGFAFVDDSGRAPTITSVAVTSPETVTIALSATPTGANARLLYAQNQPPGSCIGPGLVLPGGARGNLRDSDATASHHGYDLHNWAVHFDIPVP